MQVLVVGAGVVGLAVARAAALKGHEVIVAEMTRGIGNGVSLIIFAGIVAALPSALVQTLELGRTGALSALFIIALAVGVVAVVAVVVFVETAQRRIVVQYPKRQVGNRMFEGPCSSVLRNPFFVCFHEFR